MATFNRRNQEPKPKCLDCGSEDLKKRSNFSHGTKGKKKISYLCKSCGSANISIENGRNSRRF